VTFVSEEKTTKWVNQFQNRKRNGSVTVTFISEENDSIGFKIENTTVRSL